MTHSTLPCKGRVVLETMRDVFYERGRPVRDDQVPSPMRCPSRPVGHFMLVEAAEEEPQHPGEEHVPQQVVCEDAERWRLARGLQRRLRYAVRLVRFLRDFSRTGCCLRGSRPRTSRRCC